MGSGALGEGLNLAVFSTGLVSSSFSQRRFFPERGPLRSKGRRQAATLTDPVRRSATVLARPSRYLNSPGRLRRSPSMESRATYLYSLSRKYRIWQLERSAPRTLTLKSS